MSKDCIHKSNDLSWLIDQTGSLAEAILSIPSTMKPAEENNIPEPWEPIAEGRVGYYLNSAWGSNTCNTMNSYKSSSTPYAKSEIGSKCSANGEHDLFNSASSLNNKKIYENSFKDSNSGKINYALYNDNFNTVMSRNHSQEMFPKYSELNFNSFIQNQNLSWNVNEISQDQNLLAHMITCLNEENVHTKDQPEIGNTFLSSNYSKDDRLQNSFMDPFFPQNQHPNSSTALGSNCCNQLLRFKKDMDSTKLNFIGDQYSPPSPCSSKTSPRTNTDLVALMQELAIMSEEDNILKQQKQNLSSPFQSPSSSPGVTPTKGCVFCKNNSYHSTFYKSHVLKDDRGHCQCPVLRTYVCPLCGGTGDSAHTLKYCPKNTVTHGDPIAAGLPPGKVTNWREVATKMVTHHKL